MGHRRGSEHRGDWAISPDDHLGLLFDFTFRYAKRWGIDREDLVGIGYEILCDACRTFNPALKTKPSTHLVRALTFQLPIRYGRLCGRFYVAHTKHSRTLHHEYATSPDDLMFAHTPDRGRGSNDHAEFLDRLMRRLLSEDERFIIEARARGIKLQTIALSMGVTKERVRQVEADAMWALREGVNAEPRLPFARASARRARLAREAARASA